MHKYSKDLQQIKEMVTALTRISTVPKLQIALILVSYYNINRELSVREIAFLVDQKYQGLYYILTKAIETLKKEEIIYDYTEPHTCY